MYIKQSIRERLYADNAMEMTSQEFLDLLTDAISPDMPKLSHPGEEPLEILSILDYFLPTHNWRKLSDVRALADWVKVIAYVEPGGSEGIYLEVSIFNNDKDEHRCCTTPLFTFKTLEEGPDAYAAMGMLGGMIIYAIELFLILNF